VKWRGPNKCVKGVWKFYFPIRPNTDGKGDERLNPIEKCDIE
jgi:hypothetical protein